MKKAIILIHEFWGVNEQMKKVANRIRGEGYEVVLADLYNGKVTQNVEEARAMKDAVKNDEALKVLQNEVANLKDVGIHPENIAIWGFCMGGSYSFLAACSGMKVGAFVIYYGSMISDDKEMLAKISSPVIGVFGGLDKAIPVERVNGFKNALTALGKQSEVHIYEDADHAFFNSERPSYNEKAAKDAWEKTISFLDKNLQAAN